MSNPQSHTRRGKRSIGEYARWVARRRDDKKSEETDVYVSWTTDGEVRLIEIGDHHPAQPEVMPFHFSSDPDRDFDYPVVIVIHNRRTWEDCDDKSDLLPDDWDFDDFCLTEDLD